MAGEPAQSAWRQLVDTGMQVTEMTRSQAQRIVRQLVKEGQVAEGRAKAYVDELVARSRKRTEDLTKLVRREIAEQASALGLATQDDLTRLEKKVTALEKKAGKSSATRAKKTTKKTTGSKSSGSKSSKK